MGRASRAKDVNELGYLGNSKIKRDGIEHEFNAKEFSEYQKCFEDPAYFAENYIKVINLDEGLVPFNLYPYQQKMLRHFDDNRFSIVLACRQSGKSITSVAFILWYAVFHPEKSIAILANKGLIAKEMLSRVTLALENLPFFLQPGCKALNKYSIEFSNNSEIFAAATSASSIRGKSCSLIFLDEFALVENDTEFYTSTYPVISSGKNTKVIITSTARGIGNMFYRLWEGAMQGVNEFKPFRIDWWDVPGRDEKWKEQTIANTSEKQFEQEFGNRFIGSSRTLVDPDTLLGLQTHKPQKTMYDETLRVYDDAIDGHFYIMTVDVSKGRGQDSSAISVVDVTQTPFKQVVAYNDNKISPLLLPNIIVKVAQHYNQALVVIENNDTGQVVCNSVYYEFEYENTFVESAVKAGGIGVTTSHKLKSIGCSNLKDILEAGKLQINDSETISELSSFEEKGKSYAAAGHAHDDLVMTLVLFSWFVSTDAFGEFDEADLRHMVYQNRIEEMEDDLLDFGFISSASEDSSALPQEYHDMIEEQQFWSNL